MELYSELEYSASAETSDGFSYSGAGVTLVGWVRYGGTVPSPAVFRELSIGLSYASFGIHIKLFQGDGNFYLRGDADSFPGTSLGIPSAGAWHFYVMELDPTGAVRLQIDQGETVYSSVAGAPTVGDTVYFKASLIADSPSASPMTLALDEVAVFPFLLTTAQKDYPFNSGAGRTHPVTLP